MAASPFAAAPDGVRVAVRLTPKAARDSVDGLKPTAAGGVELAVKVTAAPEKGKANAALIRLLVKQWRVAAGDIELVAGETDRHKTLKVRGAANDLLARLDAWLQGVTA